MFSYIILGTCINYHFLHVREVRLTLQYCYVVQYWNCTNSLIIHLRNQIDLIDAILAK